MTRREVSRTYRTKEERLRVESRTIRGKPVFFFHSHNAALLPWRNLRALFEEPLILITLDHHTDTHEAFVAYAYFKAGNASEREKTDPLIEERLRSVDLSDENSVKLAIEELRNDEQIDAAIRLGILSFAVCINQRGEVTRSRELQSHFDNYSPGKPWPTGPFAWDRPDNNIFAVSAPCAIGCEKQPHDESCSIRYADSAIESGMLNALLREANYMVKAVNVNELLAERYILDIDLDYFHTAQSLCPQDPTTFHKLIRNSIGITIATEPSYVEDLREDTVLTAEIALAKILEHIETALS